MYLKNIFQLLEFFVRVKTTIDDPRNSDNTVQPVNDHLYKTVTCDNGQIEHCKYLQYKYFHIYKSCNNGCFYKAATGRRSQYFMA